MTEGFLRVASVANCCGCGWHSQIPYGSVRSTISEGTIKIAQRASPFLPFFLQRKEERNVTWKIGHKYGNLLSVMGCRKTQRKTGLGFFFCRQKTLSIKDERQSGPDSLKKESAAMSRESYDFQSHTS